MKITRTRVWNEMEAVWTILKETPTLDPFVLVQNSELYVLKKKSKVVSFLTIKRLGKYEALGTVYTFPKHRKKGLMRKLIKKALKNRRNVYLVCYTDKSGFYKRFGFSLDKNAPWLFRLRRLLGNIFIAPIIGKKLVIMKRLL